MNSNRRWHLYNYNLHTIKPIQVCDISTACAVSLGMAHIKIEGEKYSWHVIMVISGFIAIMAGFLLSDVTECFCIHIRLPCVQHNLYYNYTLCACSLNTILEHKSFLTKFSFPGYTYKVKGFKSQKYNWTTCILCLDQHLTNVYRCRQIPHTSIYPDENLASLSPSLTTPSLPLSLSVPFSLSCVYIFQFNWAFNGLCIAFTYFIIYNHYYHWSKWPSICAFYFNTCTW